MNSNSAMRYAALCLAILLMAASVAAADVSIDDNDDEIWLHEGQDKTLNGKAECSDGSSPELNIDALGSSNPQVGPNEDGSFSYTFDEDPVGGFGTYDITLTCSGTMESDTSSFDVKQISVELLSPDSSDENEVYRGKKLSGEISVDIKGSGKNLDLGREDLILNILSGEKTPLEGVKVFSADGTYPFEARIPEDVETVPATLEAGVKYTPQEGNEINEMASELPTLDILEPWSHNIINRTHKDSILDYSNIADFSMAVKVNYRGEPKRDLTSDNFYLTVRDEHGNVLKGIEKDSSYITSSNIDPSKGKYKLDLEGVPSLSIGEYRWTIGVEDEGAHELLDTPVNNYISFSGEILDAQGEPVNAEIAVDVGVKTKTFNVKDGKYDGNILPGTYNFTADFPEMRATFRNVTMREGVRGGIRYDDIPINDISDAPEGVSILNAAGIVFGYPMQGDALVEMTYDPGRVSFQNVKVIECSEWGLSGRTCHGEWNALNSSEIDVYPTVGRVKFTADPINISQGREKILSSFMVVRNTELTSESIDFSMDRFKTGSSQSISGQIVTPSGKGVGGVDVKISVLNGEEEVTSIQTVTQSNGNYGTEVPIPDSTGLYSVKIKASKDPYDGFEKTLKGNFEAYKSREVSVRVPDNVEFQPGKSSDNRFRVVNEGQRPINDVKLRINGLKNTWYEFSSDSWNSISPGGSREAVMTTNLPEDYCEGRCTEYPTFDVEAIAQSDGESINDIKNVQSVVSKEGNSTKSQSSSESSTRDEGYSLDEVSKATGKFLERQSSLNIALGLIAVFMLTLAAAIKKKKQDGERDGERRGGRVSGGSVGRGSMSKPSVTSPDKDEEEKEGEQKASEKEKEDEQDSSDSSFVCETCGEEFDTEFGLELHEQAMH